MMSTTTRPQAPLAGKTIVITRAGHQGESLRTSLKPLGAQVIDFPTIAIEPYQTHEIAPEPFQNLKDYQWVIFTSANGVDHAMAHMANLGLKAAQFQGTRIAVVGAATHEALRGYGLEANLVPEVFVAEALCDALMAEEGNLDGKRLLLLRGNMARKDLPQALQDQGAIVEGIAVYRTTLPTEVGDVEELVSLLKQGAVDMVTFTSSSTVVNFKARLQPILEEYPKLLEGVQFAAIGPITADTVCTTLGRVDIQADEHTVTGLVDALMASCVKDPTSFVEV